MKKKLIFLLLIAIFSSAIAQDIKWEGPSVNFNNGKLRVSQNSQIGRAHV